MRELRNRGGEVLAEVTRGSTLVVTRDGEPVAELRPLPRRPLGARELVDRWRHAPAVDAARLRADLDATIDMSL